ncbi:MAG: GNAT family N-acetyltransferase [Mollicutes bacterium]|nr:GNAT family N-acetyltransferase [Mollicutes bacterium]
MINIESLKDYINIIPQKQLMSLAERIYMITDNIREDYPNHKTWYFEKQLPETIKSDKRNILFVKNPNDKEEIIAMACLKRTKFERKICTLYVINQWKDKGIGMALVQKSIDWLGTNKPLITFPEYKLELFRLYIDMYNWKLKQIVPGFYNDKHCELCFNGTLTNENDKNINIHKLNGIGRILKNNKK